MYNDGYQPEPYARVIFRRTCPEDVTKVSCEAVFYYRVFKCKTCCCVRGLVTIEKSFTMTKENSKHCSSWFSWQDMFINTILTIMRTNMERDMKHSTRCKVRKYFEKNPEPKCSQKQL